MWLGSSRKALKVDVSDTETEKKRPQAHQCLGHNWEHHCHSPRYAAGMAASRNTRHRWIFAVHAHTATDDASCQSPCDRHHYIVIGVMAHMLKCCYFLFLEASSAILGLDTSVRKTNTALNCIRSYFHAGRFQNAIRIPPQTILLKIFFFLLSFGLLSCFTNLATN